MVLAARSPKQNFLFSKGASVALIGEINLGTKFFYPIFITSLLLSLVWMSPPQTAQALTETGLPSLNAFIAMVENNQTGMLRGIYVPEVFAGKIIQQPAGDAAFVSLMEDTLTEFRLASRFGSIGLLAHDFLAGKSFFLLEKGQIFYLIYGDGQTKAYVVTNTLHYQALQPDSVTSKFVDLATGSSLTASELLRKAYNRPGQVIFQTCIYSRETPSWGRLFVVAKPYRADIFESKTHRIIP
jgi:hypothetical protein